MIKNIRNIFNVAALAVIIIFIVLRILVSLVQTEDKTVMNDIVYFSGRGTEKSPYFISSSLELLKLSEMVNNGNEFRDTYFEQSKDIDLESIEQFIPIGKFNSNHYFYGIYNGGGFSIYNLNINSEKVESKNVALFGQLGGIVKNLGIESGLIEGAYIGSIASHAIGTEAKIINCYNKATIKGWGRAGGIADNFGRGQIINCWNEGILEAPKTGGICSYSAGIIFNSYCREVNIINEHFNGIVQFSKGGYIQSKDKLVQKMNNGISSASSSFGFKDNDLRQWIEKNGNIALKVKDGI